MAGPWEQFQSTPSDSSQSQGPWAKFQNPSAQSDEDQPAGVQFLNKAGSMASSVLSPIGTAVDYFDAPIRQAVAAPADVYSGRKGLMQAAGDILTQPLRPPSSAPSFKEIATKYGIPDKSYSLPFSMQPLIEGQADTDQANSIQDAVQRGDVKVNPAAAVGTAADLYMGGKGLGFITKGVSKIGEGVKALSEYQAPLKEGAEGIQQASEALGTKATKGMLSDSPYIQNLESSLEQSPSIAGNMMRGNTTPVRKAVSDTANNIFNNINQSEPSEIGTSIKKGLIDTIQNKLAPISESFDRVRESTKNIELNPKSLNAVADNIRNISTLESSPSKAILEKIASDVENADSADKLKEIRTNIGRLYSDASRRGGAETSDLAEALGKVSNLEQNSIMRAAINAAGDSAEGRAAAKDVVGELKQARGDFKGLLSDVGDIGQGSGVKRGNLRSVGQFIDRLDQVPDEDVVNSMWKMGNRAYLEKLQGFAPEQFEKIRQGKMLAIQKQSMINGELDPNKLIKNIQNIEPATKELLFGKDAASDLDNMKTVLQSFPGKMGPSGTPAGLEWQQFLSPSSLAGQVPKMAQYGAYKASDALANVGSKVKSGLDAVDNVKGLISNGARDLGNIVSNNRGSIDSDAKGLLRLGDSKYDQMREAIQNKNKFDVPEEGADIEKFPVSKKILPTSRNPDQKMFENRFSDDADYLKKYRDTISNNSHLPYPADPSGKLMGLPNFKYRIEKGGVIGDPGLKQQIMGSQQADPFSWMDQKYGISKNAIAKAKGPIIINTSSDLIGHDDYMDALPKGSEVNLYLTPPNEKISRDIFPTSPSRGRLLKAADKLKENGFKVNIHEPNNMSLFRDLNLRNGQIDPKTGLKGENLVEELMQPKDRFSNE